MFDTTVKEKGDGERGKKFTIWANRKHGHLEDER